jgi:8-oxo-dGTP pyrophosphatase MutT (NUDIX family)
MIICKPVAVIIKDRKYLIGRDSGEDFFKNIGGRTKDDELEFDCLKRNLESEIGVKLTKEPELIFDFPPTPAAGDPGDTVVLKGYLIKDVLVSNFVFNGDVAEVAWIDSMNVEEFSVTPQIKELIIPKLKELGLIE